MVFRYFQSASTLPNRIVLGAANRAKLEYHCVVACARCDGGYQTEEKWSDESEMSIEKRFGGNIVFRSESKDAAVSYAAGQNQAW